MTKQRAIIILVLAIVAGTAALYFLIGGKAPSGNPISIFTGSPFGNPPEGSNTPGSQGTGSSNGSGQTGPSGSFAKLFRLSDIPIAGAVSFIQNGSTNVRFVTRADGHVFDINPNTLSKTEVLNITSPRIYAAEWRTDGGGYIQRSLINNGETISNVAVTLVTPKASSTAYTSQVAPVRGDIGQVKVLSDNTLLYNLEDTGSVVSSGFIQDKQKTLFNLAFTNWQIRPANEAAVLLITKPSASAEGYVYLLNPKTSSFTKLLGPLVGVTALLSPDGRRLAYNYTHGNTNSLSVVNLSSSLTTNIYPDTLPDKCVWSKKVSSLLICGAPETGMGSEVPDMWYQGAISYADRIWRFNTDTNTAELLASPQKDFGVSLDVTNPILSPDEDYLFFTDKNTLSLWALKL